MGFSALLGAVVLLYGRQQGAYAPRSPSWFASNAAGSSSRIVNFNTFPDRFARITSASGANSQRICRHAPHGGVGLSVSATTATRLKRRRPSDTPLNTAVRSAHIVSP